MHLKPCFNCGDFPTIHEQEDSEYPYRLEHTNPICPFGLVSEQATKSQCKADWDWHNNRY